MLVASRLISPSVLSGAPGVKLHPLSSEPSDAELNASTLGSHRSTACTLPTMPDPERLSLPSLSVMGRLTVLPAAALTLPTLSVASGDVARGAAASLETAGVAAAVAIVVVGSGFGKGGSVDDKPTAAREICKESPPPRKLSTPVRVWPTISGLMSG